MTITSHLHRIHLSENKTTKMKKIGVDYKLKLKYNLNLIASLDFCAFIILCGIFSHKNSYSQKIILQFGNFRHSLMLMKFNPVKIVFTPPKRKSTLGILIREIFYF